MLGGRVSRVCAYARMLVMPSGVEAYARAHTLAAIEHKNKTICQMKATNVTASYSSLRGRVHACYRPTCVRIAYISYSDHCSLSF